MKKIITFLGTGDYQPTSYVYRDTGSTSRQTSKTTAYFAQALREFFPQYEIVVLATPKAQNEHGHRLQNCRLVTVEEAVTDEEMWNTFVTIQREVADGDEVVFDITHSFRSLPFLALLSLAYLRVVRQFTLQAVLYAPYQDYKASHVYDLSPFVILLDWTTATHLFIQSGFATPLVELLEKSEWSTKADAGTFEQAAAGFRLARPDEARQLAHTWTQKLAEINPDHLPSQARPFGLLLRRVQAEFNEIAPEPPHADDLVQELNQELALIHWNSERGQWMPVVTMGREWLVSLLFWLAGWTEVVDEMEPDTRQIRKVGRWRTRERDNRTSVLSVLGDLARLATMEPQDRARSLGSVQMLARNLWQDQAANAEKLGRAWQLVSKLRNDMDHAGKISSKRPLLLDQILSDAKKVPTVLRELADQCGLTMSTQS